jgi:hypothetical protein
MVQPVFADFTRQNSDPACKRESFIVLWVVHIFSGHCAIIRQVHNRFGREITAQWISA